MSDGLVLQSSAVWLCSCLSATVKNKKAFDFSSSSITHLAFYALFLLPAALHSGWHQYNWGGGCSGLNLCTLSSLLSPQMHPARGFSYCKVLFPLQPQIYNSHVLSSSLSWSFTASRQFKKMQCEKDDILCSVPQKPNKPARVFNVTKSHIYVLKAFNSVINQMQVLVFGFVGQTCHHVILS